MGTDTQKTDPYPDVDGGSFANGDRAPSMGIENHDGDIVREAVNRKEYWNHKAVGEVGGYHVMVHARVRSPSIHSTSCKLTVHTGGEWDTETNTYLGGNKTSKNFDRVFEMDKRFGELCREYDLAIMLPEE